MCSILAFVPSVLSGCRGTEEKEEKEEKEQGNHWQEKDIRRWFCCCLLLLLLPLCVRLLRLRVVLLALTAASSSRCTQGAEYMCDTRTRFAPSLSLSSLDDSCFKDCVWVKRK